MPALPEPLPLPKDAAPNAKEFNEAVENSLPSPRATPEPEPTRSAAAAAPQDATTTMEGEHAGVPAPAELVTQKAAAEQSSPVSVDRDANAMDVDEPSPTAPAPASQAATPESSIPFDVSTHGTQLTLGIPCIVAPRNVRTQKPLARFRATVKYIGPLAGHTGAWVGVEVPLPLPAALEGESSNDGTLGIGAGGWNDGTWAGVRYFLLGPPRGERSGEAGRERRRRIARMVGKSETEIESEWDDADPRGLDADGPAPAKRRKDASGVKYGAVRSTLTGKDGEQAGKAEQSETRGLFIRPSDVLWVVSSD